MSLDCNSFNANKQEQDVKDHSFSRLLTEGLKMGGEEPLIGNLKHYNSGRYGTQAKPSTTGRECGYPAKRGKFGKAKYQSAFALAEVLITLTIIGVIAALTIPSLIAKNQEKETVTRAKKAYNTFTNAFNLAKAEYGDPAAWFTPGATSYVNSEEALNKLAPFMNLIKRCNSNWANRGCFPNVMYKLADGSNYANIYGWGESKGVLADSLVFIVYADPTYISFIFDINGHNGPNQIGKDLFSTGFSFNPAPSGTETKECIGAGGYNEMSWILIKDNTDYPPPCTK